MLICWGSGRAEAIAQSNTRPCLRPGCNSPLTPSTRRLQERFDWRSRRAECPQMGVVDY